MAKQKLYFGGKAGIVVERVKRVTTAPHDTIGRDWVWFLNIAYVLLCGAIVPTEPCCKPGAMLDLATAGRYTLVASCVCCQSEPEIPPR